MKQVILVILEDFDVVHDGTCQKETRLKKPPLHGLHMWVHTFGSIQTHASGAT